MKNLKIKVISKYLRPYKKEFLYGALALLVVNILSVVIPLEVKNIIDQLQNGFSSDFVISKSLWLIFLATCMGLILSLIHISEPTRLLSISYAVFCLKKKKS